MPRPGELTYFTQIGEAGRRHAQGKPFSDADCGPTLFRLGALFSLLPPPPARVLECGCGAGWLTDLLVRRGYQVVATDISPEAVELARAHPGLRDEPAVTIRLADMENPEFHDEFDSVVFFDSLHHAVDERGALRSAREALRAGGTCILLEPGLGHNRRWRASVEEYDVTEKDMPPSYVTRLSREVGFGRCTVYPAAQHVGKALFASSSVASGPIRGLLKLPFVPTLMAVGAMLAKRWVCGTVVLTK